MSKIKFCNLELQPKRTIDNNWSGTDLSYLEKNVLLDIVKLFSKTKRYYKKNETIATEFDKPVGTISKLIPRLQKKGYINIVSFSNGRGGGKTRWIEPTKDGFNFFYSQSSCEKSEEQEVKKIKTSRPKYTEEDEILAKNFEVKVKEALSNFSQKQADQICYSESWAEEIGRLVKIDGYTHEQIEAALEYGLTDQFYIKNIRSLSSIRKKWKNGMMAFDSLFNAYEDNIKSKAPKPKTVNWCEKTKTWTNEFGASLEWLKERGLEIYRKALTEIKFPKYNHSKPEYKEIEEVVYLASQLIEGLVNDGWAFCSAFEITGIDNFLVEYFNEKKYGNSKVVTTEMFVNGLKEMVSICRSKFPHCVGNEWSNKWNCSQEKQSSIELINTIFAELDMAMEK